MYKQHLLNSLFATHARILFLPESDNVTNSLREQLYLTNFHLCNYNTYELRDSFYNLLSPLPDQ